MYRIGVAGGTGSGKSTFSKLLASKIPKAERIDGDQLMNDTLRFYEDEFFRMFGERLQLDSNGRTKLRFFTEHPARIKTGIAIAKKYLSGNAAHPALPDSEGGDDTLAMRLTSAIAMAREHMGNNLDQRLNHLPDNKTIAIIDWVNLPALDVWKTCDLKIIMVADDHQRLLRLKKRKKGRDFTEREILNMIEHAVLPYDDTDVRQMMA